MSGHTKGPWRVDYGITGSTPTIRDTEGREVARITGRKPSGAVPHVALIAAAPEMLEALKNVAAQIEEWGYDDGPDSHLAEIRTVIAKATAP